MTVYQPNHNANLLNTLPQMVPVVNYVVRDCQEADRVEYKVDYAPSKLFVKIANSIFTLKLKPRILEFYFLMAYMTSAYPNAELSIIKLKLLILNKTRINYSKNTINKYINELIELKLIKRVGKYYHVYGDSNNGSNNGSNNSNIDQDLSNNYIIKKKESNIKTEDKGNKYSAPKTEYKPFFVTIYNTDTKTCSMALELYLASKPYNFHRPALVCKELNISRSTYYKYLNDLLKKGIIKKHKVNHKINHYTNDYRQVLWNDYINVQDLIYMDKKFSYQDKNRARRLRQEQQGYKTPLIRIWFASSMRRVMKEYKINYIKAFDNYNPEDAYLIVKELEQQYSKPQYTMANKQLNAKIVVAAILNNFNWVKIVDRRHAKFKREQKREREKHCNSRYMEECFGL